MSCLSASSSPYSKRHILSGTAGTLSDAGLRLTFIFHRLGVDDQRIQASLWHCNFALTQTRTRPCLLIRRSNAATRQCDFVLRPFSGSGVVAGELSGLCEASH